MNIALAIIKARNGGYELLLHKCSDIQWKKFGDFVYFSVHCMCVCVCVLNEHIDCQEPYSNFVHLYGLICLFDISPLSSQCALAIPNDIAEKINRQTDIKRPDTTTKNKRDVMRVV